MDNSARYLAISLRRYGNQAFLQVGEEDIEISDFEVISSMHGGTELKLDIKLDGPLTDWTLTKVGTKEISFRLSSSGQSSGSAG